MSDADAVTDESAPKRTKANEVAVLVTTTDSPPPASGTLAELVPADSDTVPVGRNG